MMLTLLLLATHVVAQSWLNLPGSLQSPLLYGPARDSAWPVTNIGHPLIAQRPDDELKRMLKQVDPNRIKDIITTLANFGTRHTLSTQSSTTRGIGAARDWIYKGMQLNAKTSNGSMEVYFDSYIQPVASRIPFPVNITNVVARINGTTDPNRVYVVTGHYDSRRIDVMDYINDAPGADDNLSGVAVLMEMARICAKHRPKATMIFAATAGEEQGLYGAAHLAQVLKNGSYKVEGNWNNDIVGTGKFQPFSPINDYTIRLFAPSILYPNTTSPSISALLGQIGGENDSPSKNLARYITEIATGATKEVDMQVSLIYHADRYLRGGDHEAFLSAGFPGVRFSEAVEDFKHQHQNPRVQDGTQYGDLVEYVDFDYIARVTKVNLASMWSAANAPAKPKNVTISTVVGFPASSVNTSLSDIGNESQFKWMTSNDPLVDSYELVWRTSGSLQWTHYLNLGKVNNVTVNLPKDDLQFGIRAVGKDGKKSPAVFPLPIAN